MKKKITSIALVLCMLLSCVSVGCFTSNAAAKNDASVSASSTSSSVGANDYGLADNVQDGQILQCWNWSFNGIKNNMQKIAEQGFTAIQTSPIQTIKETTQNRTMSGSWWVYYQPSTFNIETNGQNACGTKAEFEAMCEEAHKYGVKVIVDAVLNHMANDGDNTISRTVIPDIRDDSSCWHDVSRNSWYESRWDITQFCMGGLPDLNTSNTKIQNYAKSFLQECIDAGADGFRFDGAKHIETSIDSGFASNFWNNVLGATTSYAQSSRGITPYYYGEILDGPAGSNDKNNAQNILNNYTSMMSVTSNNVSDDIRNQVNGGNAQGAARSDLTYSDGSAPAPSKAVLWNESHDTYANGSSSGQSDTTLKKTWALVGSRAESCGLYLARPRSASDQIGTASVTAWGDKEVQAVNQFKNSFIGKTEYLSSENGYAYNERGTEGVVIVNCSGTSGNVNITAKKMAAGTYTDQISGNTFTVSNGRISGNIGSTGIAVVYNPKPAGPSASVTPGSKTYKTDTLELTLSYKNATSGQYSIDGGAYQNFTDGQTITIGSGLAYGTTTTVNVKASDGTTTSDIETYTYTKADPSAVQEVYFDNTNYNWSNVYAYIYTDETENAEWPGVQMTKGSDNIYSVEVPEDLSNGHVIFAESSTSSNRSTPDGEDGLGLNGKNMIFRYSGVWEEYNQQPTTKPTEPETKPTTPTKPTEKVLLGDVDLNNNINVNDVTAVQKYISGALTLSTKAQTATDVNRDGIISIKDATCIQFYILGVDGNTGSTGEYIGGETQPTTSAEQPTTSPESYVYFKNTSNWNNVNAYYWSVENTTMTQWPGVAMESVGDNTYRLKYPEGATYIIFNNGSSQTDDIKLEGANKIYNNGSWSNYN